MEIVVFLQTVGRGQRNEKQMDYQDVRDGPLGTTPPAITKNNPIEFEGFFDARPTRWSVFCLMACSTAPHRGATSVE